MYIKPQIEIAEADFVLLNVSGPGATSIGSPNVSNDAKGHSVWDEDINDNEAIDYEI